MASSANVKDIQVLREFRVALIRFQDEARRALASLVVENERVLGWIQHERPPYWKRQLEIAYAQLAEARASLMKCRMRRTGDFKPTCYEEKLAVDKCKARLETCYKKIDIVKQWSVKAAHEVDEYRSRSNTMYRFLDGEIPRAAALLEHMAAALEKYAAGNLSSVYDTAEAAAGSSDGAAAESGPADADTTSHSSSPADSSDT